MINKKSISNILMGWLRSQPDFTRLLQLREDIAKYVMNQAILVLTDEERVLLDSIKSNETWKIRTQYPLDSGFWSALGKYFKKEFPPEKEPTRWFRETDYQMSKLGLIKSSSYFSYVTFEMSLIPGYPYQFVPYLITYDWHTDEKEMIDNYVNRFPASWEGLKSLLVEYYKVGSGLSKKTDALYTVITDSSLSLPILNKHYPELYKFK